MTKLNIVKVMFLTKWKLNNKQLLNIIYKIRLSSKEKLLIIVSIHQSNLKIILSISNKIYIYLKIYLLKVRRLMSVSILLIKLKMFDPKVISNIDQIPILSKVNPDINR